MASRMPKAKPNRSVRMHVQMPKDWKIVIKRAAAKLNMSQSNYVANAAVLAARLEIGAK